MASGIKTMSICSDLWKKKFLAMYWVSSKPHDMSSQITSNSSFLCQSIVAPFWGDHNAVDNDVHEDCIIGKAMDCMEAYDQAHGVQTKCEEFRSSRDPNSPQECNNLL